MNRTLSEIRGRREMLAEMKSSPDDSLAFRYIRNVMLGSFVTLIGVAMFEIATGR